MRNKYLILYYAVLLLLFASWTSSESVPSLMLRFVYLGAVVIPLFFIERRITPFVLLTFITIASYGYTSSFMPIMPWSHLGIFLIAVFFFRDANHSLLLPKILLVLLLYTTSIDCLLGGTYTNITHALFLIILCCFFIDRSSTVQLHVFSYTFILSALIMSYHFLILADFNTFDFGAQSAELERTGFRDINYSAGIVSMGILASFVEIFTRRSMRWFEKLFLIIVIIVSFICQLRNASRGALLALAIGGCILLLFSKVKVTYKILVTILVASFLYFLYTNSYFDLIEYRIANDDGTGSNRTLIWQDKWDCYIHGGYLNMLFGYGFSGGFSIGNYTVAFHNDFLAFLVDYGIIGLTLFLIMFLTPLRRGLVNKEIVFSVFAFILVMSLTFEPMNAGRLPYFAMWLYMLMWSRFHYEISE